MARQLGAATLGLASETGFPPIGGVDVPLLSFPAFAANEALTILPSAGSNAAISSWAVGFDVYVPQPAGAFVSLLQTGGGDGEIFLQDNGDGTAGIGISGVYDGAVPFDAWTRIVLTITEEAGATVLRKYVDGALVGTQDLGATDRWDVDPSVGLKLFNDDSGETAAGAVSSVFYTAEVPSPIEVAGLLSTIPTPNAAGFFPEQPSPSAVEINFDGEDVAPRYGDAAVSLDGFGFRSPATLNDSAFAFASQFGVDGPGGADIGVLDYAAYTPEEGVLVRLPAFSDDLSTYTAVWDIRLDDLPSFQSLLQTDPSQSGDGELFIRGDGGVGINGDYDGSVPTDAWVRLAITIEDLGNGSSTLTKYLDGALLDSQTVSSARFTLSAADGFVLLGDESNETSTGYLAHFGLADAALNATEIAALGGADVDGPFEETGAAGQPLTLTFDSHWRPFDQMTAQVLASFDGGDPVEILRYDSTNTIDDGAERNETVTVDFLAPADAADVQLSFRLSDADNDWYWAVDNILLENEAGEVLLTENFDSLAGSLQAAVDESTSAIGWTHTPPDGWSRDVADTTPQGTTEWRGWSFVTPEFWQAADGQARDEFTQGTGVIAVADGDEWDDFNGGQAGQPNSFDSTFTSPVVGLGGPIPERTLTLAFDSHWRPFDQQTGVINAIVDGEAIEIFRYDSTNTNDLDQRDESLSIDFTVAGDASGVAFSFEYLDADNDWWWAIDNIALSEGEELLFEENFDGLTASLQTGVDEAVFTGDLLGWTHDAPDGWTRTVDAPQGTTEWQGWSFATTAFWDTAGAQARGEFTKGTGVVAIADGDEWDDNNTGSVTGDDFNSTLRTPEIALSEDAGGARTFQIGFDDYAANVEFGFQSVDVIDVEAEPAIQDTINDLILRDGAAPTEIDLAAAFGAGAGGFEATSSDGSVVDATIDGSTLTLAAGDLGHSDITVTALASNGAPLEENFRAIVAGENAYVFAIIPDTQDYTSNPAISETFGNMTDWLLRQEDSLAIQHAIHVGDIVQFGAVGQWLIAEDAMERLDGEISYSLAVGNHDQQRPGFSSAFSFETDIDTYFTPEQVGATAAQGGGLYDGFDVGEDTFANGNTYSDSIRNAYTTLTTPDGTNWLIFSLEFGMPDDVLRWAGEVIEDHLDHRVIINTHSWQGGDGRVTPTTEPLTTDNDGWGYAIRENPRGINGGEDAWREFASKYPNATFTFNGHNFMGGAETTVSYAAGDNPVHQVFVNYQGGAWAGVPGVGTNGGNGAIRLMVLDPDNDRVTTHTKLVELDTFYNAFPDHEEVFEGVDLGAPEMIAIAKAGETAVATSDGLTATVSLDPSATIGNTDGATYEWFAADGEKLGETNGAPLDVVLQNGLHRLTLVVTDVDGNVSRDDKTVIVEAPAPLLTETFDDGDLAGWTAPGAASSFDFFALGTDLGFSLPSVSPDAEQFALNLTFDSHWRPFDAQTGSVFVSFDGGAPAEILRYDSATTDDTSQRNETVSIDFLAPASANEVEVFWRYDDADNDWYWAIDNVSLEATDGVVPTTIFSEDFDALAPTLQPAVDEGVPPTTLGWTHDGPDGWSRTVDPDSPAGTTEWRGWSFTTPEFWTSADGQARGEFTKGTGVIAVADGDEWDDFNGGAGGDADSLDTTIGTPGIDLLGVGGGQEPGPEAGVVRVAPLAGDEAILLTPGASGLVTDYTLIFDLLVSETDQSFTALFQTDASNSDDADIYLRNDGAGTASIGISGDYDGALAYGAWSRLALTFETDETGRQILTKYLDGAFLDTQIVDSDVSDGSRWTIDADTGLLLFSEPNGFTSEIVANSLYFSTEVLDAEAIEALGGVDVDGPLDGSTDPNAFQLNFDGALDGLDFGSATVEPLDLSVGPDTSYLVKGSIFGNPDGEGEAALYQQSNGSREVLLWNGDGATLWSNYVFDVAIEAGDNDAVGVLFYYQDEQNYYELVMDQQNDARVLNRVEDGVVTELAREFGSYRHFAEQTLRVAVVDGAITATLDEDLLFDAPITDPTPLSGGTIGFVTGSMDRVQFDNVSVNPAGLSARVLGETPDEKWAVDLDGDGTTTVKLTAAATVNVNAIASYEWLVDGAVVATGETAALALPPGETTVVLRVVDAEGAASEDQMTVEVASQSQVLVADDFQDGDFAGWTIVDEGPLDAPSDWSVQDGALVQASNIGSTQTPTGSTAFRVEGDGPFILRDGTYALWDAPDALEWTDYAVEATLTPGDDDGVGLLFRYTDPDNYYKLEADAQTGLVMMTRHLDGRETILARAYEEYTPGEAQQWRIEAEAGVLTAYIDGVDVFGTEIDDRTLEAGTVGLYAWSSENLVFDDVIVTSLEPGPNVVTGTPGNDFLIGTEGDDLFVANGGRYDRIEAGAGDDQFDFSAMREDAGRNVVRVYDYEEGEAILGVSAEDVAATRVRGDALYISLAGDRDTIILDGADGAPSIETVFFDDTPLG